MGFIENTSQLPIFSLLGEIKERTTMDLGGYQWVDIPPRPCSTARTLFPDDGPRFYGREAVAYLLDAGIANWEHITHALNATHHRPPTSLRAILESLEVIWLEVGHSKAAKELVGERASAVAIAKQASVALAGSRGRDDTWYYRMVTASNEADVPFSGPQTIGDSRCAPVFQGRRLSALRASAH